MAGWISRFTGADIIEMEVPQFSGWKKLSLLKLKSRILPGADKIKAEEWLRAAGGGGLLETSRKKLGAQKSDSWDALFLSAGSGAAPFTLALAKVLGQRCCTIMTPSALGTSPFNFAIIPEHDHPKKGKNIFHDPEAPEEISQEMLWFIGGLLRHAKGYTAVTNPLVNSYKRLVPGYEAPVHIAWSHQNRSPLIRVPARRGSGTRCELRSPDPSCNPYLAFAVMLKAGLDGIENKIEPPQPVNLNIYTMTEEEKAKYAIESLPGTLFEAITELDRDEVIQEALGQHIYSRFREGRMKEWLDYRVQVHEWEVKQYLARF